MKKSNFLLVLLISLLTWSTMSAQEERQEAPTETKIIIIEEKVDQHGNKTVTKTIREGQFTDAEIEKIVQEESSSDEMHGQHKKKFEMHQPKGYLGVRFEAVDEGSGIKILEVIEGSPAVAAGLQKGDIISQVNGEEVQGITAFVEAIGGLEPGSEITMAIMRDSESKTVSATLGERSVDESFGELRKMEKTFDWAEEHKFDKEIANGEWHQKEDKPRFGVYLDRAEEGVLVTEVVDGSIAESAGLHEGDVITSFNGVSIASIDDLIKAVQAAEAGTGCKVKYLRDGESHDATAEFEK